MSSPEHSERERCALKWVMTLQDPECTTEQLAQLDAWLAEDPKNGPTFRAMDAAWRASIEAARKGGGE
jgi:ferric-dicitrate binding protein FerR (iron transport regulator)